MMQAFFFLGLGIGYSVSTTKAEALFKNVNSSERVPS
jgi:hypothetical protein